MRQAMFTLSGKSNTLWICIQFIKKGVLLANARGFFHLIRKSYIYNVHISLFCVSHWECAFICLCHQQERIPCYILLLIMMYADIHRCNQ